MKRFGTFTYSIILSLQIALLIIKIFYYDSITWFLALSPFLISLSIFVLILIIVQYYVTRNTRGKNK